MFISSEAILQSLAIHRINEGHLTKSNDYNPLNGQEAKSLMKFLFRPFIKDERFHFAQLGESAFFQEAIRVFHNPGELLSASQNLAERLFQLMEDEKKEGEIMACHFEDCVLDDEVIDAFGVFFLDQKQQFLKMENEGSASRISFALGQSKITKGIMIFNTDVENGYQALVINKGKAGEKDPLWSSFLRVEKIKDNFFQTQSLIQTIQEFAQQSYDTDETSEKIALINESINYIKQNDFYEKEDFQEQILQSPELINRFNQFTQEKQEENPALQADHFEISKPAVRTSKRFIRSVIKLDKNFHVYVHGSRENIVKGFDEEKNKNFYTLFYEEEN